MKHLLSVIIICLLLPLSGCKKDNANLISTANVSATITSGNWRISYYWNTDHEETSNYNGYSFVFASTGVLTASSSSGNITGNWGTSSDNSSVKLIINFLSLANFVKLSTDWEVIERGETIIKLRHVSGGNGGTDFLTFEKN